MSEWIGYAVSVNCGETLGSYQGIVSETDGATITLTKAFRNGFPYPKSQVTLNAVDIKELRIIEAPSERAETHSTVACVAGGSGAGAAGGRKGRATVCERLQANPTSTSNPSISSNATNTSKAPASRNVPQAPAAARTKPVEILGSRPNKNTNLAGSSGNSGSTPKSRGGGFGGRGDGAPGGGGAGGGGPEAARRRNEACFGDAAEPALDDDFDFEGNLALFDKRAVWAAMRINTKPDVVRAADEKYRHDENVLGGGGGGSAVHAHVAVPAELRGAVEYVTDAGGSVPSVSAAVRRRLWEALRAHGLADFARAMVARAAAELALRLVGGGRRLEARNAHQAPCVVALCGRHAGGACGLAAARLVAARGARVAALVAGGAGGGEECAALRRELAACALDDIPVHGGVRALPAAPDLVLVALHDPAREPEPAGGAGEAGEAAAWADSCRAAVLSVEPAGGARPAPGGARACLLGGVAVALPPALGRLYLADVAPPRRVLAALGLAYRPPFGAEHMLALHPRDS